MRGSTTNKEQLLEIFRVRLLQSRQLETDPDRSTTDGSTPTTSSGVDDGILEQIEELRFVLYYVSQER